MIENSLGNTFSCFFFYRKNKKKFEIFQNFFLFFIKINKCMFKCLLTYSLSLNYVEKKEYPKISLTYLVSHFSKYQSKFEINLN